MKIELEEWFDAGYTLYEVKNKDFSKLTDFLLQKKFEKNHYCLEMEQEDGY